MVPLHDPALQYFLAVLETGSINTAARRLYVASSAISRQITRLESELGASLFERRPTGMVATEAAHPFAQYARRAMQDAMHVRDEVHERHQVSAAIALAATDGTGHDLLPRLLCEFQVAHPDARFMLQLVQPKTVTHMVRDGTCDLGVTFNLTIDDGVQIMYSQNAPLCAVMRRGHPLARRSPLALVDLTAYPLALPSSATTNRLLVEACAASQGLAVTAAFECDNADARMRFVRESGAVTFLGQVTVPHEDQKYSLVTVPLEEKELSQRTLQVQCRAGGRLSAPVARFADFLITALKKQDV